ncbi:type I restriction endonuclease subunit R, EcoR124 family [Flavilitoribacter nigricans]|uniref:Type I restriction enzyme endonuclease subunit n=1 Tax=Flavilitoribacter nigricans (strain ATCC 23147 / DSM 23189 / NBRC 102662 / NCIMB 1420 / SS-2) TaxID=1122177 RepID=A0A2D0NH36_FLAN2|nr:HsdR family type I site-specific deoxyribonuclease [Flavilitoribacter nigricans]PHN07814.1 deoxyribonuclease HsdR [Flavilitoribacter nigricans DSM 23189 = NBRC 102662]
MSKTESEEILEKKLVEQLTATLGYTWVAIPDEAALLANLKTQLELHNKLSLSATEFKQVLHQLDKGDVFDRAKTLRERMAYLRDDGDTGYLQLLNIEHWCRNQFQVTRQVTMDQGTYKNRYDVTLLINGLPLVQIELKRRGLEMKEAFNQINRYKRHSFWSSWGLFQYVQLFVISNGVNTKYLANSGEQLLPYKFTNFWADADNNKISSLTDFADAFLEKCHLSKMICKYIVLHQTTRTLMVLRPYQFHAVEAIIDRVQNSDKNGYIWHTTGSGKTLTSFKASQILIKLPKVHKVVFVVDRKDLDSQTIREFDGFQKGSVDSSDNTKVLVQQLTDTYRDPKNGELKQNDLIVTTIQKLNRAILKNTYNHQLKPLQKKHIVFIFDECHRSQFGETHRRIKEFFHSHQMFGFTGTPIFAKNATRNELGKRTTKDLFDKRLHQYVLPDAIRDENVLKFSVDYYKTFKEKEESREKPDILVEAIEAKEVLEADARLEIITDFIIRHHDSKTRDRTFSAIFCVSSIDILMKYYDLFQAKKLRGEHDLRIVTIFSYRTNEEDTDVEEGNIPDSMEAFDESRRVNTHSRDKLESYIADYNEMFKTKFSTKDSKLFYDYYKDIGQKLKNREKDKFASVYHPHRIDILLVVNMFLTGFDAKKINTMYVDKNLKQHGLIQAFSRTNRIINTKKHHGIIYCFRNLRSATDEAIKMFSNKTPVEEILLEPYTHYLGEFAEAVENLKAIVPDITSVDELETENDEAAFIKAFRELVRLNNIMSGFDEFDAEELGIDPQEFADYKSKYLDLYRKVREDRSKQKESILNDLDFEIELIQRVEINVAYILKLLGDLHNTKKRDQAKKRKEIDDLLGGEVELHSKKELIQKFIDRHMPHIKDAEDIPAAFDTFWTEEKQIAFEDLAKTEKLNANKLLMAIKDFIYTGKRPLPSVIEAMQLEPPGFFESEAAEERISDKIVEFVKVFDEGMGDPTADDIQVSPGESLIKNLPQQPTALAAEPAPVYKQKQQIELELSGDYDTFSNEAILQLIAQLEEELGLSEKISILLKEKGSVLLTVEMDETEANQLLQAVNSGQLAAFGIERVKLKKFLPLYRPSTPVSMDAGEKLRHYKNVLSSGHTRQLLDELEIEVVNNPALEKEVIVLLGRVNSLERDFQGGIIDYETKTRMNNGIHLAVSDLLYRFGGQG